MWGCGGVRMYIHGGDPQIAATAVSPCRLLSGVSGRPHLTHIKSRTANDVKVTGG
jgi:hypothetical protein